MLTLEQHYLSCLAQASYVLADTEAGVAAVVDPRRDVGIYLDRARELGCEIRHVLLTHFHADFIAGHLELLEATGARIWLGAGARAEFEFEPMRDGQGLELGPSARLSFLETPGHTPESCCILVHDRARSAAEPHAVLTGDTLFIGDVGRPDLLASVGVTAEELAGRLFDSTREKLLTLPDATLVYPGHGAGSACGKNLSSDTVSTIGEQRALNYALQPMQRDEFVRLVTAHQPDAPAYFAYDADLNRRRRETLPRAVERALAPLELEDFLRRANAGAQVLDAREPDAFAAGHLAGSVNVGLSGKYATWAGSVLDRERPILLIVEPGREGEAVTRLGRIGFDGVEGFLRGGAEALGARPDLVVGFERLTAVELAERLARSDAPHVLDVRTPGERDQGAIEGSTHVPLGVLVERLAEVPRDRSLVVTCAGGYRSSIAVSLLEKHGRSRVADLSGGMAAWNAARGAAL